MDQQLPPQFPATPAPQVPVPQPAPVPAPAPIIPTSVTPPPPVEAVIRKSLFTTIWFWGVLIFILNSLALFWFLVYPRLGAEIVIPDQRVVDRIHIDRVATVETAALVLVLRGVKGEQEDRVINATGLLPANVYENFDLSITEYIESTEDVLLKDFKPGTTIEAGLYKDSDGDGLFNDEVDTEVVKNIWGKPQLITFITQ